MPADFTLPELGENITTGDVLRVLVKPGDVVAVDQPVLELETDKATIEVPSTAAGRVTAVKVKAGDKVKVGQAIFTLDEGQAAQGKAGGGEARAAGTTRQATTKPAEPASADAENAESAESAEETEDADGDETEDTPRAAASPEAGARAQKVVDISRGSRPSTEPAAREMPPAAAAPSVRRLARELGVDINSVPAGSGSDGRISIEDVKAHAKGLVHAGPQGGTARSVPLPDFTRWGEVERKAMNAVRRKTAEHLSAAWATIPHVTHNDLADVTALEALRKRYAKQAEEAGGNLTVTAIAVKVVATALKVFPRLNTSIDIGAEDIIFKKYVHIGVAVDTDRGLLVPVIRDADTKNILQLSVELAQLSEKARTRKLTLNEMQGGCFSVSNLGGIGGTSFTPIVNAPEVAILGISRARMQPVWKDGSFVPRLMLPLSLSYDHRAIDGAEAARFLRWIAEAFEQPFLLELQG